jgi:hypothetical protein
MEGEVLGVLWLELAELGVGAIEGEVLGVLWPENEVLGILRPDIGNWWTPVGERGT